MAKSALFVNQQPGGLYAIEDQSLSTGTRYFVHSGTGTNAAGGGRSPDTPLATLDYAIGLCTANKNDVVYLMPGHAETLTAAGGVTCDIAGVRVIGLGHGADRPTFTFGTSTAASILVSAASVTIENVLGVAGIDALTNPFHIQAADCTLDITWREGSSTVEAARAVLTTAAADRLTCKLRYEGETAGNACVNAIRLVGVNGAHIDVDFYGKASTAVVEFATTACTDIQVRGRMYVSGTTDGSKSVVDTVTGSTWDADIYDATAGATFTGSSGSALAKDDISTALSRLGADADTNAIGALLSGSAGIATMPSAAVPANGVNLFELVRDIWASICGTAAGENGIQTYPAAAAPGNNVSGAEVWRAIYDRLLGDGTDSSANVRLGKKVTRAAADIFDGTQKAMFTVSTGKVLLTGIYLETSGAAVDNTTSNLKFRTNPTVGTDADLSANLDIDADEIGSLYSLSGIVGDATTGGSGGGAMTMQRPIILDVGTLDIVTSADVGTGGALGAAVMWYIPLEDGATVASA